MLRRSGPDRPGLARGPFIFNLGHGVLPDTDPEAVATLVRHLRSIRLPMPPGSDA